MNFFYFPEFLFIIGNLILTGYWTEIVVLTSKEVFFFFSLGYPGEIFISTQKLQKFFFFFYLGILMG